ncbi:SapC family protein [Endozoicomonas arenosclerae]|uniref:SapC family protein n=1 Tax=Endozoicomonas arenosclerae TaxID=1633495 RepID=UPI000784E782|nr:SapC family protein [Endozoicomonas arenosclerae]
MAELLFYSEPTLLNREVHKTLRFSASPDYSFTKEVNSVPLAGIEFFEASRDMPVLFGKDEEGGYFPLVMLSLMDGGHKQLDESGEWGDSYVPAFIRRYPFALTDDGTVCFDQKAGQLQSEEGDLLFNDEGEGTKVLDNIVQFLSSFEGQYKETRRYCDQCKEFDLFVPFNLKVMAGGEKPLKLDGLYVIDEKKLNEIPESAVSSWFKSGWLAWTYAHLHSVGALSRLVKKQG